MEAARRTVPDLVTVIVPKLSPPGEVLEVMLPGIISVYCPASGEIEVIPLNADRSASR
jgi:hypothetical protein